jgi:hypothetical protein
MKGLIPNVVHLCCDDGCAVGELLGAKVVKRGRPPGELSTTQLFLEKGIGDTTKPCQ